MRDDADYKIIRDCLIAHTSNPPGLSKPAPKHRKCCRELHDPVLIPAGGEALVAIKSCGAKLM